MTVGQPLVSAGQSRLCRLLDVRLCEHVDGAEPGGCAPRLRSVTARTITREILMSLRRIAAAAALVALPAGLLVCAAASAGQAATVDPCSLLTRTQVQHLLLGKRIVKVKQTKGTQANQALQCAWSTGFFQTDQFRRLNNPFTLKVIAQPTTTATAGLNRIRGEVPDTYKSVPGLGDEAFATSADLVIVSGPTVVEIRLTNYDTSKKPHPDVDKIVKDAAPLVLAYLAASAAARPPTS